MLNCDVYDATFFGTSIVHNVLTKYFVLEQFAEFKNIKQLQHLLVYNVGIFV